jgi:putative transposase
VFVALAAGGSESTDAWGDFLGELRGRGLRPPLLVISDGAAGLISAIESSLPRSLRQKCLIHYADLPIMPTWGREPLVAAV